MKALACKTLGDISTNHTLPNYQNYILSEGLVATKYVIQSFENLDYSP